MHKMTSFRSRMNVLRIEGTVIEFFPHYFDPNVFFVIYVPNCYS